ncbi:secreted protein [Mycolicibacterium rhodesiae JS60]|nr:secreted protein [Mycolicibacterium rhodesiae JS60]
MKIRITVPGFLIAALCGAALMSAPLVTAPPAHAACTAGQVYDAKTGICWSQASGNIVISGTGGTCLPGRLGLCMAAVQNSQVPGANLPKPTVSSSGGRSWP